MDQVIKSTTDGFVIGSLIGACTSYWRAQSTIAPFPEFFPFWKQTFILMGKNAAHIGAVAAVFTTVKLSSQAFRNKDDVINDGIGGSIIGAYAGLYGKNIFHTVVTRSVSFGVLTMTASMMIQKADLDNFFRLKNLVSNESH